MDGKVTLRDDPQTFELARKFWKKQRICKFCNRKFNLLDSFGTWSCKVHTGRKVRRESNETIGSGRFERQKYPRGKIEMSCCGEIIFGKATYPGVVDMMVCRPSLPLKNGNLSAKTSWAGTITAGRMVDHTARARRVPTWTPKGCTPCDCRDHDEIWELPLRVDNKFQGSSVVNIQDFAPILALMTNVEERPGFKFIDADGNVSRIDRVIVQDEESSRSERISEGAV